jgi:chorismate mutase/prephenate dehydratase
MNRSLEDLRGRINAIDNDILSLITQRASLLNDIIIEKKNSSAGESVYIYDPMREGKIIQRLVNSNQSILDDTAIELVFRNIIQACRNYQMDQVPNTAPFHISIQGIRASFSEQAIQRYCVQKNIKKYQIHYATTSLEVLNKINQQAEYYGIVAFNNARGGLVGETIRALDNSKYLIVDSCVLLVEQSLITQENVQSSQIKKIVSHPQALKQCSNYLQKNFPDCSLVPWEDTALAAADLLEGTLGKECAVIAHKQCATTNALQVFEENIQDLGANNETLFLLIKGAQHAS